MQLLKKIVFYILLIAGTLLIVVTMLSLIHDVPYWYIKMLDFPRIQTMLGLLVCLAIFAVLIKKWALPTVFFLIGLVASIVLQALFLLPYTPLADKAVQTAQPLSIKENRIFTLLVANVWMKNNQADRFLDLVYEADPDLVLAMETDKRWVGQLSPLQSRYPHQVLYPLDNTYGMVLYSRLPLKNTKIKFLNDAHVPSIHAEVSLSDGASFFLHAVHPVPPKPSEYPDNVGEEEVALLKVGKMVAQEQKPAIVAGDFNDVAWSETSRLFGTRSGLRDVRVGRGFYNSFDATSFFMRWPLDHVYVSREFRVVHLERLPKFGSDHFAILVKLALNEQGHASLK